MRTLICVLCLGLAAALPGCASTGERPAEPQATTTIPSELAPNPALEPLRFMVGRWVTVNPNGTMNEEHWTQPRGGAMAGFFRQIRRNGLPAFFEVSLVTVEADGVMLRLRHLHAGLEVPENDREVQFFKLVSAANGRAEFTGTSGRAAQIASVVYRLDGDVLEQSVAFKEGSGERGYTIRYTRER